MVTLQSGFKHRPAAKAILFLHICSLICAEIISLLISNNQDIKGMNITQDLMILPFRFANDISLFLDGRRKSFEEAINTLQFLASISGLNMNLEKTQVVWIGSKNNTDVQYMLNLNFNKLS